VNHSQIVSFLWRVADLIRDTFRRGKYQDVILPSYQAMAFPFLHAHGSTNQVLPISTRIRVEQQTCCLPIHHHLGRSNRQNRCPECLTSRNRSNRCQTKFVPISINMLTNTEE